MNIFAKELSLIKDMEILSFTEKVINNFPQEFWYKPASSTGKYHSKTSAGDGGLVEHTKLMFWIAKTMLDTKMYDVNPDIVLSACLLHDGWKYDGTSKWTVKHHGLLAVKEIDRIMEESGFFLDEEPLWYQIILDCIQAHNGCFTKEWTGWFSLYQIIVHTADMIGSRRFIDFNQQGV
jgi:23S rRNA maturation-related 3'-5' exoribonuclease YhaM